MDSQTGKKEFATSVLQAQPCSGDCTSNCTFRLNLLPKLITWNGECDEKITYMCAQTHTHTILHMHVHTSTL